MFINPVAYEGGVGALVFFCPLLKKSLCNHQMKILDLSIFQIFLLLKIKIKVFGLLPLKTLCV